MKLGSKSSTDQSFQGKIYSFSYYSSPEIDLESSIDLTLIDGQKVRAFRFFRPSQIEIDGRYSQHNFGLQILDVSDGQMEYVNILVSGHLENVGDFRFWAKTIVEITAVKSRK